MQNFRLNFKNGSDNVLCPLGCQHEDSQENFLKCDVLKLHLPEIATTNCSYMDIFSNNPTKMKNIATLLNKAFKIRESLIETSQAKQMQTPE